MSLPDDRITDVPLGPETELRPIQIPDIRIRKPLWRRALDGVGILVILALVVGGCAMLYRWSEHRKIERTVRKGFEEQMGKSVKSIRLARKADDDFRGTLTTLDGDEWRLVVTLSGNGQMLRWSARPPLARIEAQIRNDIETKMNSRIKSIDLKELDFGRYGGTIELESGEQFDLTEDGQNRFHYEWTQGTVEKWVREMAREMVNDNLATLHLERLKSGHYRGGGKGDSGLEYIVLIESQEVDGTIQPRLRIHPPPDQYERWVKRGLEQLLVVKVKSIALKSRTDNDHAGTATLTTGEVYDLRVGVPPSWRGTPRDGEVIWRVALQPGSYESWIKRGIEEHYQKRVRSLTLKRELNGEFGGMAVLEGGHRFQVRAGALKRERKKVLTREWPELGPTPDELMWETIPIP